MDDDWDELIEDAREELREKSHEDIQIDTAFKWAARACAAQEMGRPEAACDYGHEAIEHAALSHDDDVLQTVRELFDQYGVRV